MTTPLTVWTCDTCGDAITDTGRALVVWRYDDEGGGHDFRIVHKNMDGYLCDPEAEAESTMELSRFLGAEGLAYLLSFLSAGPVIDHGPDVGVADFDNFVDLVRRVQTPWYEEARGYWNTEHTQHWLSDANQFYPYLPDVLERIAKQKLG